MQLKHSPDKHRFDLYDENGAHAGEITYLPKKDNQLIANHTRVFPGYEGRGLAGQLLDALVAYAVQEGKTIKPVCPYVVSMFKKFPEKYAAVIR